MYDNVNDTRFKYKGVLRMNAEFVIELAADISLQEIDSMFDDIANRYKHNIRKINTVILK